jgi:TfoX/Sxy family transcriptional regulator of competence genes
MASSKEYLEFIMDQLSGLENVSYRAMMGEYILYCGGKVIGGIYDDRLLIKPTKSALAMVPLAVMELPYDGAKEMLPVTIIDDRELLQKMVLEMFSELPQRKVKTKKPVKNER